MTDFSPIHVGNFTVSVDETNPSKGTVLTSGTIAEWVGGESGDDDDQYAFMIWSPASGLDAGVGEQNGFYTACSVPEYQADADYGKYQILYESNLNIPTPEKPNDHVYTRGQILGGEAVNFNHFVPATSLLRFHMKAEDGQNHSVSKIVIQSEDGAPLTGKAGLQTDHVGNVHAWSHFYPAQTDQNYSDVVLEFTDPITIGPEFGDWYHAVVIPCESITGKITFIAYDTDGREVLYAEKAAPADGFEPGVRHKVELTMAEPPVYFFYIPSGEAVIPAEGANVTVSVASYRLNRETGERTTLSFAYEGVFSDEKCLEPYPNNARIRYFTGFSINGDDTQISISPQGGGIVNVSAPYDRNNNDIVLASDYNGVTARLRAMPEVGSESSPVNLAGSPLNTANTYIVNAPGWYSFPLVYGNALKNGADNPDAYSALTAATGISSPYITGAVNPYVIWEDAYIPFDETWTRDDVLQYGYMGRPGVEEDLSLSIVGDNVVFHLPADGIDQGNLVIGVRDSGGRTLWNWQIWVTDYSPLASDNFMQRPLGATLAGTARVTTIDGTLYTKWVQDESGKTTIVKLTHKGSTGTFERSYSTSGVNYQWGRKDSHYFYDFTDGEKTNAPKMIIGEASVGYGSAGYDYFVADGYNQDALKAGSGTLADGIAHPAVWYYAEGAPVWYSDSVVPWSETVKTIFDPSPAGFRVPSASAALSLPYGDGLPGEASSNIGEKYISSEGASEPVCWVAGDTPTTCYHYNSENIGVYTLWNNAFYPVIPVRE